MRVPARLKPARRRRVAAAALLTTALVTTTGVGLTWADHAAGQTVHVCVSSSGVLREAAPPCRPNERADVLVTEAGLASLAAELRARVAALVDADEAADARLDALEADGVVADGRLDALEAGATGFGSRLDALEAADTSLDSRLDALESRVAALELAVSRPEVTFTKVYDGGHYASYTVTGSGFDPGSTVTSGVGTTATVSDDGTFSVFGGNLFCDRDVSITGTAVDGSPVTRSAPVECDSEAVSAATATFSKVYDGGHYASYTVTGTGFRPGSTVTSGVGTTATVADDGTFSVFGGNLFCDRQVSVSGIDSAGRTVTRSAEVVCDSESTGGP